MNIEKIEKLVANLLDIKEYVIYIRNKKFKTNIKSWINIEKSP